MSPVHTYNPVQIHRTIYTNTTQTPNIIQARQCERKYSPKTQISMKTLGTLGCYAREHPGEENYEARGEMEGWPPLRPPALGVAPTIRGWPRWWLT